MKFSKSIRDFPAGGLPSCLHFLAEIIIEYDRVAQRRRVPKVNKF